MFLSFYGLEDQPFGVTPDPKYLFWSRSHREALASLYYGIESGCGFMTLIAPPGMGKTTLLFYLLERLRSSSKTAYLFQTQCSSRDFLRFVMADLGWDSKEEDPVALYEKLYEVLIAQARAGKRFILVIDEAQNLEDAVLETVRLLSNFETPNRKLMQVVLAGQTQLSETLARFELWQLRQRISIMTRLEPLTAAEVTEYVEHRFKVAGYNGSTLITDEANIDSWSYFSHERAPLFTAEALALIASASKGIPRIVNSLCFNALSLGCAQRQKTISTKIVREVIADLELERPPSLDTIPASQEEPQTMSEAPTQSAVKQVLETASPEADRPVRETILETLKRDFPGRIRPILSRMASRRFVGIAASLVLLLLAGLISLSLMIRKPPTAPENTVHAASSVEVVRAASTAAEKPSLPGGRQEREKTLVPHRFSAVMTVTVGRNENLDSLSRKYLGTRLNQQVIDEILLLNPQIVDPNRIETGDRIRLPLAESWITVSSSSLRRGTNE
jgi:general secretion pathway protein A